MKSFNQLWPEVTCPVVGMLHCPPLPGAPRNTLSMDEILYRIRGDAEALIDAGFHGLMVENFGDVPFFPNVFPLMSRHR